MPWPAAILWGAAALIGATGIKKGYDAKCDYDDARIIGERAEKKYKNAQSSLDSIRNETQDILVNLGRIKVDAFTHQIKHLVDMHKKFKSRLSGYEQQVFIDNLPDIEVMVERSLEIEKGLGNAAIGGALAAFGAYSSVGLLATASTGTAIGALSGAAATNATLAWLGGGSLAAGGFGVAGGMVALGGIALAPLLAIGGFWMAGKAEQEKTNAVKYSAEVNQACEKMKTIEAELKGLQEHTNELAGAIQEMVKRFERVKVYTIDDKEAFDRMLLVGKGLKGLLDIAVMNNDGSPNDNVYTQCRGYLALGK